MERTVVLISIISAISSQEFRYPSRGIIRPSTFVSNSYKRGFPIARLSISKPLVVLDVNRPLPCCKDESGGAICRAMRTNDPKVFANKCNSEPDFSLVVCCKSCDEIGTNYRERATNFFSTANNGTHCFDRMSSGYCSRYQTSADAWSNKRWSCHSEHNRLAFRVCRATCGFCNLDWRNAPEPSKCL